MYNSAVDKILSTLPVSITGARVGDTIRGISSSNRNVYFRICGENITPIAKLLRELKGICGVWVLLLKKIGVLSFFRHMDDRRKNEYFAINSSSKTNLKHFNDLYLELLSVGDDCNIFHKFSEDRFNDFEQKTQENLSLPISTYTDFVRDQMDEDFSENIPNRNAKINSFIFGDLSTWVVENSYTLEPVFTGMVINADMGKVVFNNSTPCIIPDDTEMVSGIYTFNLSGKYVGIVAREDKEKLKKWNVKDGLEIINEILTLRGDNTLTYEEYDIILYNLSIYGASGLKSVLQKCIRYNANKVKLTYDIARDDKKEGEYRIITSKRDLEYDLTIFTMVTWFLLFINPGSFNPNIQRFVRGRESAFKRLAVIIVEDSYTNKSEDLSFLLTLAYLTQKVPDFKACKKDLLRTLNIIYDVCNTSSYFDLDTYETHNTDFIKYTFFESDSCESLSAQLIKLCGSFASDIQMFQHISYVNDEVNPRKDFERPSMMYLEHSIDHHCFTDFFYFIKLDWFRNNASYSSKVASGIFKKLWTKLSKCNWRRGDWVDEDDIDVLTLDYARKMFARTKYILENRKNLGEDFELVRKGKDNIFEYNTTLSDSWLAGMVGTIYNDVWLMTLKPENIETQLIAKKINRGDTILTLSDSERETAIEEIDVIFKKGVKVASVPCNWMHGAKVFKVEGDYKIINNESKIEELWEECKDVTINYKQIDRDLLNHDEYCYTKDTQEGIVIKPPFGKLCSMYNEMELARAVALLYSDFKEIKMPTVARDGGGTKLKVTLFDVGAFQILHQLANLYPSILFAETTTSFRVRDPVGLIMLREIVGKEMAINRGKNNTDMGRWGIIEDSSSRTLFDYQRKAIDTLNHNFEEGKKGSFVWLTVGSGKSLIAMTFLRNLIRSGKMSKRVIYTLPPGALNSLAVEITMMGFHVVLLSPVQRKANVIMVGDTTINSVKNVKDVPPYCIALIVHDHLKKVEDDLVPLMGETTFIVDEVHKGLGDTLRTSALLNCALLSYHFIAMTGTPTIDSNTGRLIPWLRMITNYPVTHRNHLVAINSMVSDSVNVGVNVVEEEKEFSLEDDKLDEYMNFIGVKNGGSNDNPTMGDLLKALRYCYDRCDVEIIRDALDYERSGRGVFIVVKDDNHQKRMFSMLSRQTNKPIFCITSKTSLTLTNKTVEEGMVDYRFVIAPMAISEGYTCTRLSVSLSSTYFSNEASRTQMRGRINRVGQTAENVTYVLYTCEILSTFANAYKHAKNIKRLLSSFVD